MSTSASTAPDTPSRPLRWRLAIVLWLLGMPGILAMVWTVVQPVSHRLGAALPPWAVTAVSGLQSSLLLALAVALGVRMAPQIGLDAPVVSAWLQHRPVRPLLQRLWLPGIAGGVVGAAWLVSLSLLTPQTLVHTDPAQSLPLVVKLLYGGLTEELLVRWGVMTVAAFVLWRLFQHGEGPVRRPWMWLAIALSACVFAAGHVPAALALTGGMTVPVAVYIVIGNVVFGLLAGYLYWRHGLEAAMLAHALAHAFSHGLT